MRPGTARPRLLLLAVLCTGALLLLAASITSSPASAHGGRNRTVRHDVTYVAMLVPHHESAVQMASVARSRATNAQVRRLTAHIAVEQRSQIRQMQAWLERHDAKPEPPSAPVREMERQDLQMLRAARGVEVDRLFLMMMRPHHAQAVAESTDELEHGRNAFAVSLARATKTDQAREIAQMNDLLAALA